MFDQVYTLTFGEVIFWLFTVGVVFTIYGLKIRFEMAVSTTIDSLIENGFLKTRKNADGEIEVLKYDEADDQITR
jgi:hypothetical protein